jgi:neopullulanase
MSDVVTPDWVRDAVFYQIFPDTFARSVRVAKPSHLMSWDEPPRRNGYKGGDLLGIVEHLDHLIDLGINALYLCPIFQSASNHRYHTHDYYQVDPMLGGNAALRALLDVAHERELRIVIDGVFNHASRGFFQFNDILENGPGSAYIDWFTVLDRDRPLNPYDPKARAEGKETWDTNYACWWDLPALPEFNTDHPGVRAFLWEVATHWIEFGIDGWRLDVPECIEDETFWQTFRERVKAANPDAYLVGEIWHPAQEWLRGDRFDAVMNYVLSRAALCFFGRRSLDTGVRPGGYELEPIGAKTFAERIDESLSLYPTEVNQVQLNLLGSHDTPRTLSILGGDRDALKLCWLFLATFPGAPCIYYGDEVGMTSATVEGYEGRGTMSWDEADWDTELRDTLKRYIALRLEHGVLRRGSFASIYASDAEGVYAYQRRDEEETIVVILNNGATPYEPRVPVDADLEDGTALADLLGSRTLHVRDGHIVGPPLAARSGIVLRAT